MDDTHRAERLRILRQLDHNDFERICKRCGACCGAFDGDPCRHLRKNGDGTFLCEIYKDRFGNHTTVHGTKMDCVPILEILEDSWTGDFFCAYKEFMRTGDMEIIK